MRNPFILKLYDVIGDNSIVKVEIANWNGLAVKFARNQLSKIAEIKKTGVYILIGDCLTGTKIYVGEGDPIKDRIMSHNVNKSFWEYAIIFVSKDDTTLNKTHIQYLEHRLIHLAQKTKKCDLDNGNTPTMPTIDEFNKQESEDFLSNIIKILEKLDVWLFYDNSNISKQNILQNNGSALTINQKGIIANGEIIGTKIVVKKDSQVVTNVVPSCPNVIVALRQKLQSNGTILDKNGILTFESDYLFNSLSQSACVILGMSANGKSCWK